MAYNEQTRNLESHDPVTLNPDQPTQDAASISGQALQLVPAGESTYGVVKLEDLGSEITADNGLTANTPTNVQLGGVLTKPTQISSPVAANVLSIDGVNTFANGPLLNVVTAGANGSAIRAEAPTGVALQGVSGSGAGLYGTANGAGGNAILGWATGPGAIGAHIRSDNGLPLEVVAGPASTNTVVDTATLARSSSGTPANGIGQSISFHISANGGVGLSNQIITKWTNAAFASRTSELSLTGVNNAATNVLLTISGAGIFTLTQGLLNFVDDAAAAIGGIPINGLYRNGSITMIRVS